jgi:hypothetical protein
MKKKISYLAISLALAFAFTSFFSFVFAQTPSLIIESPKNGEVIAKDEALIRFKVENFTIKDFRKNPPPAARQGHIHFWIDQANPTAQSAIQHISKEPYLLTRLEPKEHTLIVELVGNDHSSLKPPIKQKVMFTTTGIPKKEGVTQITPLTSPPVKTAGGQIGSGVLFVIIALVVIAAIFGLVFYYPKLEKIRKRKIRKKADQGEE